MLPCSKTSPRGEDLEINIALQLPPLKIEALPAIHTGQPHDQPRSRDHQKHQSTPVSDAAYPLLAHQNCRWGGKGLGLRCSALGRGECEGGGGGRKGRRVRFMPMFVSPQGRILHFSAPQFLNSRIFDYSYLLRSWCPSFALWQWWVACGEAGPFLWFSITWTRKIPQGGRSERGGEFVFSGAVNKKAARPTGFYRSR